MSPSDCRPCSPLLSLPVDSIDGQPVRANTASVECVGMLTAANLITKRTVASGHKDVTCALPPESTSYFLHFEACLFPPITRLVPRLFKYNCVSANLNISPVSRQPHAGYGMGVRGQVGAGIRPQTPAPPSHAHCRAGSVMSHCTRMGR